MKNRLRLPTPRAALLVALAVSALGIAPFPARAHKISAVSLIADFDTKTATYKVELAMEVQSSGNAALDDQIPPEEAARTFATEVLSLYFDDTEVTDSKVEVKLLSESDANTPPELQRQKAIGTLTGAIPKGAENFMLHVDEATEITVIMAVVKDGKPARRLQVLYPGEFSNPISILPLVEGDPFTGTPAGMPADAPPRESPDPTPAPPAKAAPIEGDAATPAARDGDAGFARWIARGFAAVVPKGPAHALFILAIFLLSLRFRPLARQVAIFTITHSLALAVAAFGLVKAPESLVVPVVAISAAVLAIDNLLASELKVWRAVSIAVLGLAHGFAFSDALWAFKPRLSYLLPALCGFNLGIELAQLALLATASLAAAAFARQNWFRHAVVVPVCVLIAGISIYLALEPVLAG